MCGYSESDSIRGIRAARSYGTENSDIFKSTDDLLDSFGKRDEDDDNDFYEKIQRATKLSPRHNQWIDIAFLMRILTTVNEIKEQQDERASTASNASFGDIADADDDDDNQLSFAKKDGVQNSDLMILGSILNVINTSLSSIKEKLGDENEAEQKEASLVSQIITKKFAEQTELYDKSISIFMRKLQKGGNGGSVLSFIIPFVGALCGTICGVMLLKFL